MPQQTEPPVALDQWIDALCADDEAREVVAPTDLLTAETGGRMPTPRLRLAS